MELRGGDSFPSLGSAAGKLGLSFEYRHRKGRVIARCGRVPNPRTIGQAAEADGFPVCMATVRYSGQGYDAFFGWIQLVCSTDNGARGTAFEMDPLSLFQDAPSPYAFYGLMPSLFDAPSRESRKEMQWVAHSFLATTPLDSDLSTNLNDRRVVPLVGFSWGFDIDPHENITVHPMARLPGVAWGHQVPLLRRAYPGWKFETAMKGD
jgi:hypothetical protein